MALLHWVAGIGFKVQVKTFVSNRIWSSHLKAIRCATNLLFFLNKMILMPDTFLTKKIWREQERNSRLWHKGKCCKCSLLVIYDIFFMQKVGSPHIRWESCFNCFIIFCRRKPLGSSVWGFSPLSPFRVASTSAALWCWSWGEDRAQGSRSRSWHGARRHSDWSVNIEGT